MKKKVPRANVISCKNWFLAEMKENKTWKKS